MLNKNKYKSFLTNLSLALSTVFTGVKNTSAELLPLDIIHFIVIPTVFIFKYENESGLLDGQKLPNFLFHHIKPTLKLCCNLKTTCLALTHFAPGSTVQDLSELIKFFTKQYKPMVESMLEVVCNKTLYVETGPSHIKVDKVKLNELRSKYTLPDGCFSSSRELIGKMCHIILQKNGFQDINNSEKLYESDEVRASLTFGLDKKGILYIKEAFITNMKR